MPNSLTDWLRNLRTGLTNSLQAPFSDSELLARFSRNRDEEAFAALVARHGQMVFGVCRRVCGLGPDAEDAFQAAFVVLATKSSTVARSGRIGAWLHGVALHTACVARDRTARQRSCPYDLLDQFPAPEFEANPDATHIRQILDEVLAGLPEKYRAAVVLCHLEGLSRKEASARLGWTEGTLSGRLARALKMLADRLSRRGLTAGLAGLTTVLSMQTSMGTVPRTLAASTVTAAVLVRGGIAVPPRVAALYHEVTFTMFLKNLKLLTMTLLGAGFLAVGVESFSVAGVSGTTHTEDQHYTFEPSPVLVRTNVQKPAWRERVAFALPGGVTSVAFGTDLVAAGDAKGNVTVWDLQTGKEKQKVRDAKEAPGTVDWLGFNPDSTWLYHVSQDRTTIHGCSLDPKNPLNGGVGSDQSRHFGVSPDGAFLVATNPGNKNTVWFFDNKFAENVFSGKVVAKLEHPDEVLQAVVSDDGKVVATTTKDGTIRLWEYPTEREVWSAKPEKFGPKKVAITTGGKRVAVAGKDGSVRVFDEAGKESAKLSGHTGEVNAIAFSPDGKVLATAGEDKTIRVWDANTGKQTSVLKGHDMAVTSVAFGGDSTIIVSGSSDKAVKVWELKP
jgi:RNA polymerase sigma factor (sigma-70 family)